MKKVKDIIIIALALICIVTTTSIYTFKLNQAKEKKLVYYYECIKEIEGPVYNEKLLYEIYINKNYSIRNLNTSTIYLYNKLSFEQAKEVYKENENATINEEERTVTIKGKNEIQQGKIWSVNFIEQLENNSYKCELKSRG